MNLNLNFLHNLNFLDIAIIVVWIIFLIRGIWRGLLREICSLAGLILGAVLAHNFSASLGKILMETFGVPQVVSSISAFLAIFLVTVMLFGLLGSLLSKFVKMMFLGEVNRLAGGLFGIGEGVVLVAIALFVTTSVISTPRFLQPLLEKSELATPLVELGKKAFDFSRDCFKSLGLYTETASPAAPASPAQDPAEIPPADQFPTGPVPEEPQPDGPQAPDAPLAR